MKLLGERVLLSKVEQEKTEGFDIVQVHDSSTFKGKIEQIGEVSAYLQMDGLAVGATVLFKKYSPDTEEVEHEGKKMKVVNVKDIIAIL